MSRPPRLVGISLRSNVLQQYWYPLRTLHTEITQKLSYRFFQSTQNNPSPGIFANFQGTSKQALVVPRGSHSIKYSQPLMISQLTMVQECIELMDGWDVLGLEAMTMAYLLRKADLILSLSQVLFLMSRQMAGAPVRSRRESFACPIFRIQKLPQAWAQAFQRMMGLMSLSTGLQQIRAKRLSTSISMHFPLSNRLTLKVLVLPSYSLWLGILAFKTQGRWARLAKEDTKQQLPRLPCLMSSVLKEKDTQGLSTIYDAGIPSQKMLYSQLDRALDGVSQQTPVVQTRGFRGRKLTWFQNYLPAGILKVDLGRVDSCCCCIGLPLGLMDVVPLRGITGLG